MSCVSSIHYAMIITTHLTHPTPTHSYLAPNDALPVVTMVPSSWYHHHPHTPSAVSPVAPMHPPPPRSRPAMANCYIPCPLPHSNHARTQHINQHYPPLPSSALPPPPAAIMSDHPSPVLAEDLAEGLVEGITFYHSAYEKGREI